MDTHHLVLLVGGAEASPVPNRDARDHGALYAVESAIVNAGIVGLAAVLAFVGTGQMFSRTTAVMIAASAGITFLYVYARNRGIRVETGREDDD